MDSFETIVGTLLQQEGYWVRFGFKVELTKGEKRAIGRPSSPRWELDIVGYRANENQVLVVECKSYLDSPGVRFEGISNSKSTSGSRYKLFNDSTLRRIVLRRLVRQLEGTGLCAPSPNVVLGLATGKVVSERDRELISEHFQHKGWRFLDDKWIRGKLSEMAGTKYEDNVAIVATKILMRSRED